MFGRARSYLFCFGFCVEQREYFHMTGGFGAGLDQLQIVPFAGPQPAQAQGKTAEESKEEQFARELRGHVKAALEFLTSPCPGGVIAVLKIVIEPEQKAITRVLHCGSRKWRLQQLRKEALGQPREFRVLIAANQTIERDCIAELFGLMHSAGKWLAIPLSGLDTELRRVAFKLVARQGAAQHELILRRHAASN